MKWKPSKQPLLTRKAGSTGFTTGKLNPQPPPPNPSVATYCKTHSMGEATNQHQTEGLEQFSELRCSLTATAQRENWPYSILGRWTDWVKKKKWRKLIHLTDLLLWNRRHLLTVLPSYSSPPTEAQWLADETALECPTIGLIAFLCSCLW